MLKKKKKRSYNLMAGKTPLYQAHVAKKIGAFAARKHPGKMRLNRGMVTGGLTTAKKVPMGIKPIPAQSLGVKRKPNTLGLKLKKRFTYKMQKKRGVAKVLKK